MQCIATNGQKLDLHIHSCFSASKDGEKVKNNTLERIPLLISNLNAQNVNMCAITDHDTFSYEMYSALKIAEIGENSIEKVLPGVEFSVCFSADGQERIVHVIAIFSDDDNAKIRTIESVLNENRPSHNQAYREEEFLSLLRTININTILIAHQKNSLMSTNTRKNDANTLGPTKFLEFIYTDYFEAFEFKNRRNELLNKNYLHQNNLEGRLRLITGTDCHDWAAYPAETTSEIIDDFPYTYAKCLPTFKGLVMAITDHNRLKTVDSFFTATKYTLPEIRINYDDECVNVPLSKGINVIIGDNSVGKSMLLHALTGYVKLAPSVKNGYKKYVKQMGADIKKQITQENIFCFDMQGEVRSKFAEDKLIATDFLGKYFPEPIDNSAYKSLLDAEVSRMLGYLNRKFEFDEKLRKLSSFQIEISIEKAESLTFVNNIGRFKGNSTEFSNISLKIENVITQISELEAMKLDNEDKVIFSSFSDILLKMKGKYDSKAEKIEAENSRMEAVSKVVRKESEKHNKSITDAHKKREEFNENTAEIKQQVADLIHYRHKIGTYEPNIVSTRIRTNSNHVNEYEFVSRLQIEEINTIYFASLISSVLKSGYEIDWRTITEDQLKSALLGYNGDPVLTYFKDVLRKRIEEDLRPKNSIIVQGEDRYAQMSSGFDAKTYFTLLSYETRQDGVYIIDQPEDDISQSAIREYLLDRFKIMGSNRQVIMVTHNPQFVVNLDVDNLVFLSKKGGILKAQYGALEYVCDEYSILDIVAQNIDGGLDSIRKRWKRYEKTADL